MRLLRTATKRLAAADNLNLGDEPKGKEYHDDTV